MITDDKMDWIDLTLIIAAPVVAIIAGAATFVWVSGLQIVW